MEKKRRKFVKVKEKIENGKVEDFCVARDFVGGQFAHLEQENEKKKSANFEDKLEKN